MSSRSTTPGSSMRPVTGQDKLQTALDDFTNVLSLEEKRKLFLSSTTKPEASDIVNLTSEIDKVQGKKVKKLGSRFRPFLSSIQQFSSVIETFIQANPEVAALVWGSVKMALLITMNFFDYFEKISQMFMELGCLCPILQDYQHIFPDEARLQHALSDFYAVVIEFCTKVVTFLKKNGLRRFIKAAWKPFEVQFGDIQTELTMRRENIDLEIRLASDKAANDERQEMSLYRRQGLRHRLFEMKQWEQSGEWRIQQDEKQKKLTRELLLAKVSDYDYQATFARKRRLRQEGTGTWLFRHDAFKDWQNGDFSILWSHGKPGSGKTILATGLIDQLFQDFATGIHKDAIAYFFCDFQHQESLEPGTIIRALVKQILSLLDPLPRAVQQKIESSVGGLDGLPPTFETLHELLIEGVQAIASSRAYIIIDGLDECEDNDRHLILSFIFNLVRDKSQSFQPRVFISSRKEIDLSKRLESCRDCRQIPSTVDSNAQDIQHYIQVQLAKLDDEKRLCVSKTTAGEIKRALSHYADGMFLWVAFQLQEMCHLRSEDDIKARLKSLPRGLNKTYQLILERIARDRDPQTARDIFQWIAGAKRPLTLAELCEGVAFRAGDTHYGQGRFPSDNANLLGNCGNLVVEENDEIGEAPTLRFAHFTVLEFLRTLADSKLSPSISSFHTDPQKASRHILDICLTYLRFSDFERQIVLKGFNTGFKNSAALEAPITNWMSMAIDANINFPWFWKVINSIRGWPTEKSGTKLPQVERFLLPDYAKALADNVTTLQKSYKLLPYCVAHWVDHGRHVMKSDRAYISIKNAIFDRPLPVDFLPWSKDIQDERGQPVEDCWQRDCTIFRWAFHHNHRPLMEMVVSRDERPLTATGRGTGSESRSASALVLFASNNSKNYLDLLLKWIFSEESRPGGPAAILLDIVRLGLLHSVKMSLNHVLLTCGPTEEQNSLGAAIYAAADSGHREILDFLLTNYSERFPWPIQRSVYPPDSSLGYSHPIGPAWRKGHSDTIKFLFRHTDFEKMGNAQESLCIAVRDAVSSCDLTALKLLFQLSIWVWDSRVEHSFAQIALELACRCGDLEIADYICLNYPELLNATKLVNSDFTEKGWNEKFRGYWKWPAWLPPFLNAASNFHKELLSLLMKRGADVNLQYKGKSAMECCYQLLDRGGRLDTGADILTFLVGLGAGMLQLPGRHPTILHMAAEKGQIGVLKAILLHPNMQSMYLGLGSPHATVLAYAVRGGNIPAVEQLLERGANPEGEISLPLSDGKSSAWGNFGAMSISTLDWAAAQGNPSIVEMFVNSLKSRAQLKQNVDLVNALASALAIADSFHGEDLCRVDMMEKIGDAILELKESQRIDAFLNPRIRYRLKNYWIEQTKLKWKIYRPQSPCSLASIFAHKIFLGIDREFLQENGIDIDLGRGEIRLSGAASVATLEDCDPPKKDVNWSLKNFQLSDGAPISIRFDTT